MAAMAGVDRNAAMTTPLDDELQRKVDVELLARALLTD